MTEPRYVLVADSPFIPEIDGGQRETAGIVSAAHRAGVLDCLIVYVAEAETFNASLYEDRFGCDVYVVHRNRSMIAYINPLLPFIAASRPVLVEPVARLQTRGLDGIVACSFKVAHAARALASQLVLPFVIREHNLEAHYYRELARSSSRLKRSFLNWESKRIDSLQRAVYSDRHLISVADISRTDGSRRETGPHVRKVVVPPLATGPAYDVARRPDGQTVLFVGNLSVETNELALGWFITNCWPSVRRHRPDAVLLVVGRRPKSRFESFLTAQPRVECYFDVDDLGPYYSRACVAINPIQSGSGVNIKLVDYLSHAVPTVTTSEPARALGANESVVTIADDADQFAASVVDTIENPNLAQEKGNQSCVWLARRQADSVSDNLWASMGVSR